MRVFLLVIILLTAGAVSAQHWLDDHSDHRWYGKVRFYNPGSPWLQDSLWGWAAVAETARYAIGGYADSARIAGLAHRAYLSDSLGLGLLRIYLLASGWPVVDSAGARVDTIPRLKVRNTWRIGQD